MARRLGRPSLPTTAPRPRTSAPGAILADGLLPRTGIVLIGCHSDCRALAAMLAALDGDAPVIAGWIDLEPESPVARDKTQQPAPRLGTLSDLAALIPRLRLRCAVACASDSDATDIRAAARNTGLDLRIIPTIETLLTPVPPPSPPAYPRATLSSYQAPPAIDLGALIGRTPHALDREAVARVLTGKRILITGAGGSIGAELAPVAAGFAPESLILMERAENALFEIDRQMGQRHPAMSRRAVLHDVTDAEATMRLLAELRPHVVFHAAAHKHVPLMEDHPGHAITNNLFGTKSIADAAVAAGAERFVMISSDKAVNPTSVMGATKRLAELYIRGLGSSPGCRTRLSMVRFGNVLGSACSVLTIWSSQIAEFLAGGQRGDTGGITITDSRMTRFFMTIPEAATLVVQSLVVSPAEPAKSADGTESSVGVYVLDMGDPIRVVDLASRFVLAHGLFPVGEGLPDAPRGHPTIDLIFAGARPGEKLHEELAYAAELLRATSHPGVRVWAGPGFGTADVARTREMVAELASARFERDRAHVLAAIRRHVPEMGSPPAAT